MKKTILLIDMNAFFASVEQASNPNLKGKPVIVCGEGRTVVVAASYEAKKLGVKNVMSLYEAKKICPSAIQVYSDPDKYIDTSFKIHEILLDFTDQVEVYSIDECFLDVTDSKLLFGDGIAIAKKIKQMIKKSLDLTCSIGIAENKLLAKLASEMQKPDGLVEIKPEDVPKVLENLPVEEFWGIGEHIKKRMNAIGIKTAKELGEADEELLRKHFGILGIVYRKMGQGRFESPVKTYYYSEKAKSMGHSCTFRADTKDLRIISSYIQLLSEKVGSRLRKAKMSGNTLSLCIRYSDFETFSKHKTLKNYIYSGFDIYSAANSIFESLLPLKKPVRLVGVSVSNLISREIQDFLFEDMMNKIKITEAMDKINLKYGEFTVKPGSSLIAEKFRNRSRSKTLNAFIKPKFAH